MKVVAFEVEDWEAGAFHGLSEAFEVRTTAGSLQCEAAEDYADAEAISTFIQSDLSETVLERLPRLKLIATRSTGFDHIDLDFCAELGITVCNVPRYGAHTVAEHVFGLLLTLSHRLDEAINRTRKGDFSSPGIGGNNLETLLANHVVSHLRNVVVTPHSALNTREAVQRILDTTMENIEGFAQGNPVNVVSQAAV